jgi:thiamine biosynthesis lipoprotein
LPFASTTLTLYDHAENATFVACFDRIETILHKFNMYSADSEISSVNRAAGTGAVPVSEDFCEALHQGLQLASLTDGLFDPTVGPLVKLWGIGSDKAHIPRPEEIRSVLRLVGWREVVLDEQAKTVALQRPGMTLDFGALLKGFAAVETGRLLSARGVKSAVVDIGGSVLALGSRPDGAPWRIGIQKPGALTGTLLGVVKVRDEVVNTSGSYEQFFIKNGRRYQHILDPHSGYPVDNGVEAVTVIANRLHNADGPTLAVLALGVEKGLAFANQLGVDVVIIGADHRIHMTTGVSRRFSLLDPTYSIAVP